ncbi:hypothetical protein HGRIS_009287 [Hohenbuehelia grisea]|uniref:Carboxylesterase type B domain-containing protein n=1 Tax=Hohenbuehelia grisea TaxID=104357 RepID=A0ABR3J0U0_9AGAR
MACSMSFATRVSLLLLLLGVPALCAPEVTILDGATFIGRSLQSAGQEAFRGIPFAEAPIGQKRLRPPVRKAYEESRISATEFGPYCLQPFDSELKNGTNPNEVARMSEDCLTINIQRPAGLSPNEKIPVMVWIHGGAFSFGGGTDPQFNATNLVGQSMARVGNLSYGLRSVLVLMTMNW